MLRVRAVMAGTVLWVNHRGVLCSMGATDMEFYRWIWRDVSAFVRGLRRDCVVTHEIPSCVGQYEYETPRPAVTPVR